MKAIVQDRYGAPDVLSLREIDPPVAGAGQVLVRVRAASVNARDWHLMRGEPRVARPSLGLRTPKVRIRGTDFAGTVEAVGAGVSRFRAGDAVYGEVDAAFAELVAVPDDRLDVKPLNIGFEQAAAVPLAANTALVGLRDCGRLQPGQKVLINGASGGVGTFAVQIGKALGAHVTGVCSTRNLDLVRSLGADRVVDYTKDDFATAGERYDVVLDLVGNRSLRDLRRVLTPRGIVVLSGGGVSGEGRIVGPVGLIVKGQLAARLLRRRVAVLTAVPSRENLATLTALIESGQVTPVVDRSYPLGETPEAIRYVEVEHARAKVVLTV